MILGWSLPRGKQEGGPFEEVFVDGISAIFLPTDVKDLRPRAMAQLDLMRSRDGFLPAAPHVQLSREDAVSWTRSQAAAILARLRTLKGCVQVTAQMAVDVPDARKMNESWLRARMRKHVDLRAKREGFERSLRQVALDFEARAIGARWLSGGIAVDLLVRAEKAEDAKQNIASILRPSNENHAVVGPLPAYGFSDISEAICATH